MEQKEKVYKITLFGAQGAGKDTQAELISKKLGIPAISTGDLYRKAIKEETEIGKKAKKYYDLGVLMPDDLTNRLLDERFLADDCKKGFILNGYPRNLEQAEYLDAHCAPTHALEILISDEEAVSRISGRRTCVKCNIVYHVKFNKPKQKGVCDECNEKLIIRGDDKPAAIEKRLKIYHEQTEPLIEYYQQKGIYFKIDGTPTIDEVTEEIFGVLGLH